MITTHRWERLAILIMLASLTCVFASLLQSSASAAECSTAPTTTASACGVHRYDGDSPYVQCDAGEARDAGSVQQSSGVRRVDVDRFGFHKSNSGVAAEGADAAPLITRPYARPGGATTAEQRASVQGRPCVDCGATADTQVADHIDPLVKEYYRTGTIDLQRTRSLEAVQPQCPVCSASQGGTLSWYSRAMRDLLDL